MLEIDGNFWRFLKSCLKYSFFVLLFLTPSTFLFAQKNMRDSAEIFLNKVSQVYAGIKDYKASVTMSKRGLLQQGILYYLNRDRLKIEYSQPARQVLLITDNLLQFYLPEYEVIMEQRLEKKNLDNIGGVGVGRGLDILQKNYSVSYLNTSLPQPLFPESSERVIKLRFIWKVNSEGFRELEMSINPQTLLIRRVIAVTSFFERLQFDFLSILLNSNIPKYIFVLELDDSSRVTRYSDFIYGLHEIP